MVHPQLKLFIETVRKGSFTKAGEVLHLTPTALIKQINQLEGRIGVKLFHRTHHGVTLSAAGTIFYEEALAIISLSEHAIGRVQQAGEMEHCLVRVGTSLLNPCAPFIERWLKLSNLCPEMQLRIVPFDDDHNNILNVINSLDIKLDLFSGVCDDADWLKRCQFKQLDTWSIQCAVPKTHPLANAHILELESLKGIRMMMVPREASQANRPARDELIEAGAVLTDSPKYYDIDVFNDCSRNNTFLMSLSGWRCVHPAFVTLPIRWRKAADYTIPFGIVYGLSPSETTRWILEQM